MGWRRTGWVLAGALLAAPPLVYGLSCNPRYATWELTLVSVERVGHPDEVPSDAVLPPASGAITFTYSSVAYHALIELAEPGASWECEVDTFDPPDATSNH